MPQKALTGKAKEEKKKKNCKFKVTKYGSTYKNAKNETTITKSFKSVGFFFFFFLTAEIWSILQNNNDF